MKFRNHFFMLTFLSFSLSTFAHNEATSNTTSDYFEVDATEEVTQFERCNHAPKNNDQTQQMILSVFSNLVEGLFNIALNKDNPTTVATNIVSMVSNVATIAAECTKNMPADMPEEEYQKCLTDIEAALKRCLRSISLVKKR